jgi:hypothetical protein
MIRAAGRLIKSIAKSIAGGAVRGAKWLPEAVPAATVWTVRTGAPAAARAGVGVLSAAEWLTRVPRKTASSLFALLSESTVLREAAETAGGTVLGKRLSLTEVAMRDLRAAMRGNVVSPFQDTRVLAAEVFTASNLISKGMGAAMAAGGYFMLKDIDDAIERGLFERTTESEIDLSEVLSDNVTLGEGIRMWGASDDLALRLSKLHSSVDI